MWPETRFGPPYYPRIPEPNPHDSRISDDAETSHSESRVIDENQSRPSQEIRGDVNKSNIIEGSRSRRPRQDAYLAQLQTYLRLLRMRISAWFGHIRIRIRKSESTAIIIRNSYPQIWILADIIAGLHSYYPQYPQYPHCDGVTCDLA
jgi:hypothetical protein